MAALCKRNQKQTLEIIFKQINNNNPYRCISFNIWCNYSDNNQLKYSLFKLLIKTIELVKIVKKQNLVLKQPSLIFPQTTNSTITATTIRAGKTAIKATKTSITTTTRTTAATIETAKTII